MNIIILPILFITCSIPLPIDRRFNWKDIQEVGGLKTGKSVILYLDSFKDSKGQLVLPVFCDVSGTQEITVNPTKQNSGIVFKEFKHKIKGNKIYFYLIATVPSKRYKSPKATGIYLKDIKPGNYDVYYLDSDKKSISLGMIEFKTPEKASITFEEEDIRVKKCAKVFTVFRDSVKLGMSLPELNRFMEIDSWLENSYLTKVEVLGGLIPVNFSTENSVFCIHLYPGKDNWSDWVIYLSISGVLDVAGFKAGLKDGELKEDKVSHWLFEFALCYPDKIETFRDVD